MLQSPKDERKQARWQIIGGLVIFIAICCLWEYMS